MRQILFQPVQFVDVVFESDVQITSMESGGGDRLETAINQQSKDRTDSYVQTIGRHLHTICKFIHTLVHPLVLVHQRHCSAVDKRFIVLSPHYYLADTSNKWGVFTLSVSEHNRHRHKLELFNCDGTNFLHIKMYNFLLQHPSLHHLHLHQPHPSRDMHRYHILLQKSALTN